MKQSKKEKKILSSTISLIAFINGKNLNKIIDAVNSYTNNDELAEQYKRDLLDQNKFYE